MKRLLSVFAVMMLLAMSAKAYDFKYLAFEKTDGNVLFFGVEDVVINRSEGMLVISAGGADTQLDVNELTKMYFTNDEPTSTAIASAKVTPSQVNIKVYNIAGEYVGEYGSKEAMPNTLDAGVYIIKSDDRVVKTVKNMKR